MPRRRTPELDATLAEQMALGAAARRQAWREENAKLLAKKGLDRWVEELLRGGSQGTGVDNTDGFCQSTWAREVHREYIQKWRSHPRRKHMLRLIKGGGESTCPRGARSFFRPGSGSSVTIPGYELHIERLGAQEAGALWRCREGVPWPGRRQPVRPPVEQDAPPSA